MDVLALLLFLAAAVASLRPRAARYWPALLCLGLAAELVHVTQAHITV